MNFVSRNVSVVDLHHRHGDRVDPHRRLPPPGSQEEIVAGRRGDVLQLARPLQPARGGRPSPPTSGSRARAGSRCASCHFDGPDRQRRVGVRHRPAQVDAAERELQPAQPRPAEDPQLLGDLRRGRGLRAQHPQRLRARARSRRRGVRQPPARRRPRAPSTPTTACSSATTATSTTAPCVINAFPPRRTRTARSSRSRCPAAAPPCRRSTALREWVRLRGPHAGRADRRRCPARLDADRRAGRRSGCSTQQGCANCHGDRRCSASSIKDFTSPPAAGRCSPTSAPAPFTGNPVGAQYLNEFLRNINSFNLGVPGRRQRPRRQHRRRREGHAGAERGGRRAARRRTRSARDYNADGRGIGFTIAVAARHRRLAALLPQRRLRDARLRAHRRQAPHRHSERSRTACRTRATANKVVQFLRSID